MAVALLLLGVCVVIYLLNSLLQEVRSWLRDFHKVHRDALDPKPLVVTDSEEVPEDVQ